MLNLQVESDSVVHCVITGNTYHFRSRMDWWRELCVIVSMTHSMEQLKLSTYRHQDSFGIQGGWDNPDAPDRKYLRLLKNIDVSEQDQVDRFRDMIGDAVTVHVKKHIAISLTYALHA